MPTCDSMSDIGGLNRESMLRYRSGAVNCRCGTGIVPRMRGIINHRTVPLDVVARGKTIIATAVPHAESVRPLSTYSPS